MRFVLDNDVDAGLQGVFARAGHECWRGAAAGYSETDDDELTVYADNHNAVLVTHDREFTERRKRNTIGQHVRITCPQPDACEVVEARMADLVEILEQHAEIVVEVSSQRVRLFHPHWL